MFYVRALVGDAIDYGQKNNSALTMPDKKPNATSKIAFAEERYDSVKGFTNGSEVYMLYGNCLAYPAYLIRYTSSQ